jgi:hypothetical protein
VALREAGESGGYSGQLVDLEPYRALIVGIEPGQPYEDGSAPIKVVLQLSDNDDDTLWQWITAVRKDGTLILGKNKTTGKYSALRRFINAATGRPDAAEIAAFDDETGRVWFKDGSQDDIVGRHIVFRGENGMREDGSRKFTATHWQTDTAPRAMPTQTPAHFTHPVQRVAPAPAPVDLAEVPF